MSTMSEPVSEVVATAPERLGLGAQAFRRVMGLFPTGVAILTATAEGRWYGMTINSLTAVSLAPLTVLVCVDCSSTTAEAIHRSGRFAVNLLAADQEALSRRFVRRDQERFVPGIAAPSRHGTPRLLGCLGFLDCEVSAAHPVGDHWVFYGAVHDLEAAAGLPLVYWQGAYTGLA